MDNKTSKQKLIRDQWGPTPSKYYTLALFNRIWPHRPRLFNRENYFSVSLD